MYWAFSSSSKLNLPHELPPTDNFDAMRTSFSYLTASPFEKCLFILYRKIVPDSGDRGLLFSKVLVFASSLIVMFVLDLTRSISCCQTFYMSPSSSTTLCMYRLVSTLTKS